METALELPSAIDAANHKAEAMLGDGTAILIRAIRPGDKEALREGMHRLSATSSYYRFLGSRSDLSESELRYLTEVDFDRHVALVALVRRGGADLAVGVARYIIVDDASRRAEVAVTVDDDHQGRGIGTLLLSILAEIARASGINEFTGTLLAGNRKMIALLEHSGFPLQRSISSGVVDFRLQLL